MVAEQRRYVRCPEGCDHGLIFARDAAHRVKAWFVCAVCQGSGKVPRDMTQAEVLAAGLEGIVQAVARKSVA